MGKPNQIEKNHGPIKSHDSGSRRLILPGALERCPEGLRWVDCGGRAPAILYCASVSPIVRCVLNYCASNGRFRLR